MLTNLRVLFCKCMMTTQKNFSHSFAIYILFNSAMNHVRSNCLRLYEMKSFIHNSLSEFENVPALGAYCAEYFYFSDHIYNHCCKFNNRSYHISGFKNEKTVKFWNTFNCIC